MIDYMEIFKTMNNFETIPKDKQRINVFFIDDFFNGMYHAEDDCVWFGGGADTGAISRDDLIAEAGMWKAIEPKEGMMQSNEEITHKVEWFSELMETVLKKNAHKNGWQECGLLWLVGKLNEEMGELARILVNELHIPEGDYTGAGDANSNPVLRAALFETVDIANIALMLGDLISEGKIGPQPSLSD